MSLYYENLSTLIADADKHGSKTAKKRAFRKIRHNLPRQGTIEYLYPPIAYLDAAEIFYP